MLLIDAHVHVYGCYDLSQLLFSAEMNFKKYTEELLAGDSAYILLLANRVDQEWPLFFAAENKGSDPAEKISGWRFYANEESESIVAENDSGFRIVIVAGRQLITAEGLEVLSLLTMESFQEGVPVGDLLADIDRKGGIAVLPWAFGKWFGKRGRCVRGLQEQLTDGENTFFFGDNGGRPWCIPLSPVLQKEKKQRRPIFSGSDPLPLAGEEKRVGSFGIKIPETLDHRRPAAQLRTLLRSQETAICPYGRLNSTMGFVSSQLRLRTG